jgi:predicted dehydrogenase
MPTTNDNPVPPERATLLRRRKFIELTTASAGMLFAPISLAVAEGPRKIKLGFLGTAHSHFGEKLKVVRESTDFELVGLCEEEETQRAKGPAGAQWLSAGKLFADAEVIAVESRVKDHARHAAMALRAGKHVHLEKPPADRLEEFRELQRIAAERKRLLQVGYMWRYNPGINAVLEAARKGWLGEVYLVRATMNTLAGPDQRREWGRFRGGAMFEQGCHLIDPLIRLLGRPTKVSPFLKHSAAVDDDFADNTVAVFEFRRALGIITSAPLQPNAMPHRFFEVLGTNGTARVHPIEPPALTFDLAAAMGPYTLGRQEVKLPAYRRYVDEFVALAAAIRENKPLAVTPEEELRVQEWLLRACDML